MLDVAVERVLNNAVGALRCLRQVAEDGVALKGGVLWSDQRVQVATRGLETTHRRL